MFAFTRWVAVSLAFLTQDTHFEYPSGPIPTVYVADIFPTRTRHYGLALASASQWLWSKFCYLLIISNLKVIPEDFVVSKVTPTMITNLGYKIFFLFGTINIVGMGIFSLYVESRPLT
jgi:hypothetical protein